MELLEVLHAVSDTIENEVRAVKAYYEGNDYRGSFFRNSVHVPRSNNGFDGN